MDLRHLGTTGIRISPLGLGTVKFGRNQQVKYPQPFALPTDQTISNLLHLAQDLGINLLDTAPAYGNSMARLGRLLPQPRHNWVIVSKVGETFVDGHSSFDFSYKATIDTVEACLRILGTDYLDAVLIHSDGADLRVLNQEQVVTALYDLKTRGLIRAHGLSGKTVEGGLQALQMLDLVMITLNPDYPDELPVLQQAQRMHKGILIKKGLQSGHITDPVAITKAMRYIFAQPGVSGLIVGTINPAHLQANVAAVKAALS